MEKYTLNDVQLVKEDGKHYITTKYTLETDKDIREVTVDKVPLLLNSRPIISAESNEVFYDNKSMPVPPIIAVDLGYGKVYMPNNPAQFYTEKVITEKVHELTPDEIEEKLGFKVKIVNHPIKSCETCGRCRFGVFNGVCGTAKCEKCDRHLSRQTPRYDDLGKTRCECSTIKFGAPCPYFKELKKGESKNGN